MNIEAGSLNSFDSPPSKNSIKNQLHQFSDNGTASSLNSIKPQSVSGQINESNIFQELYDIKDENISNVKPISDIIRNYSDYSKWFWKYQSYRAFTGSNQGIRLIASLYIAFESLLFYPTKVQEISNYLVNFLNIDPSEMKSILSIYNNKNNFNSNIIMNVIRNSKSIQKWIIYYTEFCKIFCSSEKSLCQLCMDELKINLKIYMNNYKYTCGCSKGINSAILIDSNRIYILYGVRKSQMLGFPINFSFQKEQEEYTCAKKNLKKRIFSNYQTNQEDRKNELTPPINYYSSSENPGSKNHFSTNIICTECKGTDIINGFFDKCRENKKPKCINCLKNKIEGNIVLIQQQNYCIFCKKEINNLRKEHELSINKYNDYIKNLQRQKRICISCNKFVSDSFTFKNNCHHGYHNECISNYPLLGLNPQESECPECSSKATKSENKFDTSNSKKSIKKCNYCHESSNANTQFNEIKYFSSCHHSYHAICLQNLIGHYNGYQVNNPDNNQNCPLCNKD